MAEGRTKKKMGRPPVPAAERRGRLVAVYLNAAEHRALAQEARESGMSVSAHLAECWRKQRNRRTRR